jgi:plasmid stabilization system protein ParE
VTVAMGIVTYLPDAIEDLHKIWDYVADQFQSMEVADRLIDAIEDVASTYAIQPHLGIPRPELADEVRCFPVGS